MKRFVFCVFVFVLLFNVLNSKETSYKLDPDLYELYIIAIKNINFSSSIPEDSIISVCKDLKAKYQNKEEKSVFYEILAIEINSLCLKGNMGLAINKANEMYEDANRNKAQLGIALSLQAQGETYLHASQLRQAQESFREAFECMEPGEVPYAQARLLIQQMYVCVKLNDMPQLQKYIFKAVELLQDVEGPFREDLNFYISCYQTLYAIDTGETALADGYLKKTLGIDFPHAYYDGWKFYIRSRYDELVGNYEQALMHNDSLLKFLGHRNLPAYIMFSVRRAGLYEKCNELEQACDIYTRINDFSDSLNVTQYTSQIDSLRVVYWVDRMGVENAASSNRMLTLILLYCLIILVLMIGLIGFARKKNRLLHESQKRLSEKRYEASDTIRAKSLFLSNMSHELRTPLSAIVSFSGLLADHYEDDGMNSQLRQQCTEVINKNSNLLFKRLNDIAEISDLREKEPEFVWSKPDVVTLCKNLVSEFSMEGKAGVQVQFKSLLKHLAIEADPGRLRQVLVNLLTNALQFTSVGRVTLELGLVKDNGRDVAQFVVEDTGCGIPPDEQPTLFQQFENVHEKKKGVGLSLSICLLVVTYMGGKIWLDASYTRGARFVFTLPVERNFSEKPGKE